MGKVEKRELGSRRVPKGTGESSRERPASGSYFMP
jgi:hypothetical protein